jgi:hypothetical protein
MNAGNLATESREVKDFDRVILRDYGELTIEQGEQESLTIETDADILPRIQTKVEGGTLTLALGGSWADKLGNALTTSLTRKRIGYVLRVKKLTGLEVLGAASVTGSDIETERLALILRGAGSVKVDSLTAQWLEVDLPGMGSVDLSGHVSEQTINISGAGSYNARKLESKNATVELRGAGKATVWAAEELDVTIRGLGSVEYYGSPTVNKNISGLGRVTSLGSP